MKKAWFVSTGEYSDYRVLCVALDQKTAEAIAQAVGGRAESTNYRDTVPNTWQTLSITREITAEGMDFKRYASSSDERVEDHFSWDEPEEDECKVSGPVWQKTYGGPVPACISITVRGQDFDRVRKRFSEVLAQTKANAPIIAERLQAEERERQATADARRALNLIQRCEMSWPL